MGVAYNFLSKKNIFDAHNEFSAELYPDCFPNHVLPNIHVIIVIDKISYYSHKVRNILALNWKKYDIYNG